MVSGASIAPDGSILLSYLMFEGEGASLKADSSVIPNRRGWEYV